jgi:twitching motility protein PilT
MQTAGKRGMQTLEQALADLIMRGVISQDMGMNRSSRPEQLLGLLERAGMAISTEPNGDAPVGTLRAAGS